ncbi:hypothetical protein [Dactylosporangium salmoneum]|uniref:Uncharacterized protein n=1 Tax=Dactylosporangium salmoneum TaxID=53361 RepID=A0ABP5ST21_9ACTN
MASFRQQPVQFVHIGRPEQGDRSGVDAFGQALGLGRRFSAGVGDLDQQRRPCSG